MITTMATTIQQIIPLNNGISHNSHNHAEIFNQHWQINFFLFLSVIFLLDHRGKMSSLQLLCMLSM